MPRLETFYEGSEFVSPTYVLTGSRQHWTQYVLAGAGIRFRVYDLKPYTSHVRLTLLDDVMPAMYDAQLDWSMKYEDGVAVHTLVWANIALNDQPTTRVWFAQAPHFHHSTAPPSGFPLYARHCGSGVAVGRMNEKPMVTSHHVWRDSDVARGHRMHFRCGEGSDDLLLPALFAAVIALAGNHQWFLT